MLVRSQLRVGPGLGAKRSIPYVCQGVALTTRTEGHKPCSLLTGDRLTHLNHLPLLGDPGPPVCHIPDTSGL